MQKDELIAVLKEAADLLEVADASSFQVMAYRNAAQTLDTWTGDLLQAVKHSTVTEIPSVGKGIAKVIHDLVQAGASQEVERIHGLVPRELPKLLKVRGLGPKRVRALWQELSIEGPDDLRRAADEGRVEKLKGFGAKTVERILSGLDYLQKASQPARAVSEVADVKMPAAPKSSGRLWAGTSGYSYPGWKGTFYPSDARTDDLLALYSERLATVEINNTFYRFPSEKVVQQWRDQTPASFQFAIKAHRRITHQLRLSDAARDRIVEFVERCGQLEGRLACILFQLPPDFARDDSRLDLLFSSLPSGARYAIEFRHDSWFDDDLLEVLRDRNIACVSGECSDGTADIRHVTADFVYTRLRRTNYADEELQSWDDWFREQTDKQHDVMAYLKHDDEGSVARRIVQRWGS